MKRKRRVLVVGDDEHAAFVSQAVEANGGAAVRLLPSSVPRTPLSLAVSRRNVNVRADGARVDDVVSVYVKSLPFGAPLPDAAEIERREFTSWRDRYTAERERHAFLTSTLNALSVPVVNPLHTFALHLEKARAVAVLARAGVDVPATLATCDPDAVRVFARQHRAVIYKPLSGGAAARLLVDDDLADDRLALLAYAPALFQERIGGNELRVYVLDGAVVGSFAVPTDGVVDARANIARASPVAVRTLPSAVRTAAITAARACGLVLAAVDVRVAARRCVVLDVNPAPAILPFDAAPDGAVVTALARFLIAGGATPKPRARSTRRRRV